MIKSKNKDGYILLYAPNHPKANNGKFFEHIIVMEKYLGRPLPEGTEVHHKNCVRTDNRIENLLLMRSKDDHLSLHVAMDSGNTAIVQAFEDWSIEFMTKLKSGLPEDKCFSSEPEFEAKEFNVSVDNTHKSETETQIKLFVELKKERRRLAAQYKVPAYIIFHDKTLIEMSKSMPDSESSMLKINGIGPHKFRLYGTFFIEIVKQFKKYLNVA